MGRSSARGEASATGVEADGAACEGADPDADGIGAAGETGGGGEVLGAGEDMQLATRIAASPAASSVEAVRRRRAEVIARVVPQSLATEASRSRGACGHHPPLDSSSPTPSAGSISAASSVRLR